MVVVIAEKFLETFHDHVRLLVVFGAQA